VTSEVVGGFVEEEDIRAGFEHSCEVDTVTLAPERMPTFFCWSLR